MEIPFERLPPDVLKGVIEEFVLREGTDYGGPEFSLADKVAQVQKQLQQGLAVVVYDTNTETCDIMTRRAAKKINEPKARE